MKKNIIKIVFSLCSICLLLVAFFFPAIIAGITGNWWFLILFGVSWIPTIGALIGMIIVMELLDEQFKL